MRSRWVQVLAYGGVVTLLASGCGPDPRTFEENSPGTNARSGDVLLRYAHFAEPEEDVHPAGSDVGLHVWLENTSDEPGALTGASTPLGEPVEVLSADGVVVPFPVALPPGEVVELSPDGRRLVVRDIDEPLRAATFEEVTFTFERAPEITLLLYSQVVTYDEGDA